MQDSKRFPWIPALITFSILVISCICAVVFGGSIAYIVSESGSILPESIEINLGNTDKDDEKDDLPFPSVETQTTKSATARPAIIKTPSPVQTRTRETAVNLPTQVPSIEKSAVQPTKRSVEPTIEERTLSGKQVRTSYRIFDDFSSIALDWYQTDTDDYSIRIENGVYNIHVKTADNMAWTEFPVDFIPYEFSFDVRGPAGEQDGTFGTECNYLDDDNLYYVEFDLATNEYTMAAKKDGVITPLTKKNSQGQYWWKASALKSPATSVNHIAVSCYLDSITLFVNDKLVYQAEVKDPLPEPGVATLYVYTYRAVEGDGYKVTFDNLEAFQPRQ